MPNVNTFKKYGALLQMGLIPSLSFFLGLRFYGFMYSLAFLMGTLLLCTLIANLLLSNPFTKMIEGGGILLLDISSTGIIRPSTIRVQSPYIYGKIGKTEVKDVFDRATVHNIAAPQQFKSGMKYITDENNPKKGGISIELSEDEYNKARFGFWQYPCLIWNDQIKSLVTKDFLGEQEKATFAEHGLLYLNRKMEELTSVVRDFGRYIVELTKPQKGLFSGKTWMWIIIIIVFIILAALFAKPIWQAITGASGSAIQAATPTTKIVTG
jgi:hypothetical protein